MKFKSRNLRTLAKAVNGVAASGHDRTIINIKPEHVDAWLNPDAAKLETLYAIFDDKQHPYYAHQLEKAA